MVFFIVVFEVVDDPFCGIRPPFPLAKKRVAAESAAERASLAIDS